VVGEVNLDRFDTGLLAVVTAHTKGVSRGGDTCERTLQKGSHEETLAENAVYSRILS
jgi:hypothetical protein